MSEQDRELLPCPFCGEPPIYKVWSIHDYHCAECANCSFEMDFHYSKEELLGVWNTRAAATPAPVGVPDALAPDSVVFGDEDDDGYRMGWNACRAAMLAAALAKGEGKL